MLETNILLQSSHLLTGGFINYKPFVIFTLLVDLSSNLNIIFIFNRYLYLILIRVLHFIIVGIFILFLLRNFQKQLA
jgi:hypothetical protein